MARKNGSNKTFANTLDGRFDYMFASAVNNPSFLTAIDEDFSSYDRGSTSTELDQLLKSNGGKWDVYENTNSRLAIEAWPLDSSKNCISVDYSGLNEVEDKCYVVVPGHIPANFNGYSEFWYKADYYYPSTHARANGFKSERFNGTDGSQLTTIDLFTGYHYVGSGSSITNNVQGPAGNTVFRGQGSYYETQSDTSSNDVIAETSTPSTLPRSFELVIYFKLNDVGSSNGIIRQWTNGVLDYESTDRKVLSDTNPTPGNDAASMDRFSVNMTGSNYDKLPAPGTIKYMTNIFWGGFTQNR